MLNMKNKTSKLVYAAAAVLFLAAVVLTAISFSMPEKLQESAVVNNIEQKCDMDYMAETTSCTLYPKGGIIKPEGVLLGSITQALIFNVKADINADKAVVVNGSSHLDAVLVAEKYWERKFPITEEKSFNTSGESNSIISGSFRLNTTELFDFINKVEKETNSQPNRYLLKIQPEITGNIAYNGTNITIEPLPPIVFDVTGDRLVRVTDTGEEESTQDPFKGFLLQTPVTVSKAIPQYLVLLGLYIPVVAARYAFCILALALAGFWLVSAIRIMSLRAKQESETQKIEKKYGKRIFLLNLHMSSLDKRIFELRSFNDLLKLSDDRELPIFKVEENPQTTNFLLIDADNVYLFSAQKSASDDAQPESIHPLTRKRVLHETI